MNKWKKQSNLLTGASSGAAVIRGSRGLMIKEVDLWQKGWRFDS